MSSYPHQDAFVAARSAEWRAVEGMVITGGPLYRRPPSEIARFATLYRNLCGDLVHARSAGYTSDLVAYLDGVAGRAHGALHRAPPFRARAFVDLVTTALPRALRRQRRFHAIAALLFFGPLLALAIATVLDPTTAELVLPRGQLEAMSQMYADELSGRSEGADAAMAGFYVNNNIGIAFRCFATGVLFGLGAVFFLVYNGLSIGATVGFVIASGHGHNILTFICTHGVFELSALVIAGGAGLQMGYSLISTGGRTRLGSIRAQVPDLSTTILGAAVMLAIAAGLEAFWSPSSIPAPIKWATAALSASLLLAYLLLAGRGPTEQAEARR
ncbi:MAG: stage II sporulation protein M [Nannocystaceae bacterium]